MKTTPFLRALALVITLTSTALHAQVPQILNYQGRVAVGDPPVNFDGSGGFKFALVQGEGPTLLWKNDGSAGNTEPAAAVDAPRDQRALLGPLGDTALANMTPIPTTVFANPDVRLRVWFNDGVNASRLLTPDQRIAAVGYTMMAGGLAPGVTIPASAVVTPPPGMVLIPAGAFMMGNTVASETDITDDAPVSTTVSAFYMDVNEVTLSQWQAVYYWATSNGYSFAFAGARHGAESSVQT